MLGYSDITKTGFLAATGKSTRLKKALQHIAEQYSEFADFFTDAAVRGRGGGPA